MRTNFIPEMPGSAMAARSALFRLLSDWRAGKSDTVLAIVKNSWRKRDSSERTGDSFGRIHEKQVAFNQRHKINEPRGGESK